MNTLTLPHYIAMDVDGSVYLYRVKPIRFDCGLYHHWVGDGQRFKLAPSFVSEMVPDITPESEPIEVEITIKVK